MYGDLVVMIEVAAFMSTMNFLACAETSAAASAFGVSIEAGDNVGMVADDQFLGRRLATSGAMPPLSLRINSIFLPATYRRVCFM